MARPKTGKAPLTSQQKTAAHRERMKAAGFKQITLWVRPETEGAFKAANDALIKFHLGE